MTPAERRRLRARGLSNSPAFVAARGKVAKPVRPNVGVERAYKRDLERLIDAMHRSVNYWIQAAYRANPPKMATDDPPPILETRYEGGALPWKAQVNGEDLTTPSGKVRWFKTEAAARAAARIFVGEYLPAADLTAAMQDLGDKWRARFDQASGELAGYFSQAVGQRSDAVLHKILSDAGMTVNFQVTAAQRDILEATTSVNVALIKSIPEQYLGQVEGMVMRSVQTGRDLGTLTKGIEQQFGVTRRRAALIARDQNNKATASLTRARQVELGIREAVWLHSGGGKHKRPKHVAATGTKYDVTKGLKIGDKGQWVFPGEEINCRCVCRPVIPGMSV